jgi:23S rRNA (pseudouridine1915-N3)-methyltransferase
MRISLIVIGKTSAPWLRQGIDEYVKRLSRYAPFQYVELPDAKLKTSKPTPDQLKSAEAPILLKALGDADHVVLLDEHGKQPRSIELAQWVDVRHHRGIRHLALVIGGAYGFAPEVKAKATEKLALSALTFSHQMIRLLAVEQLYRAQTILRGEPYHHE